MRVVVRVSTGDIELVGLRVPYTFTSMAESTCAEFCSRIRYPQDELHCVCTEPSADLIMSYTMSIAQKSRSTSYTSSCTAAINDYALRWRRIRGLCATGAKAGHTASIPPSARGVLAERCDEGKSRECHLSRYIRYCFSYVNCTTGQDGPSLPPA